MLFKIINKNLKKIILLGGLLIPLIIFLNRFLIPDLSFDSVNYHVFFGQRSLDFWKFETIEFYPTGLHSFSYFFDSFGGILRTILGFRLGSITSLLFLYGIIFIAYKIIKLFGKKITITNDWLSLFLFINIFISFEAFFQLGTYFIDIISEFFVLLSLFFIFRYIKKIETKWLWLSSLVMGLAVMGKLTNLIFAIPFGILVSLFVLIKNKSKPFLKLLTLINIAILLILPLIIESIPNINKTGNPVFPFYNAFFKSKYADPVSFKNTFFGPSTIKEKIIWPIVSLKQPVKLGEAHDLFNDFKLNIYFVIGIISLIGSYFVEKKGKRTFLWLNLFFMALFIFWNFTFGYLRYGLVLESLGGIILFIWWFNLKKIKTKWRFLGIGLVLLFSVLLAWRDKIAVNLSLAYDLSWRRSFLYDKENYLKEKNNFTKNNIFINDENYKPEIYLNCSVPNLTFYALSNYNNLPVVNIDKRANSLLTGNKFYTNELAERIKKYTGKTKDIKYVTITANGGLSNQYADCKENLKKLNYRVEKEIYSDNFLGFKNQTLVAILGKIDL